ncbi:type I restriction-modification system subunit M [Brachybacterium halotolerans subsp. kimchii]|uniref:class I SAM-dependent DNA methyltransferase n=1 Tax=Brachybacterium halotolerans TaxID=2795215 RepID=UPI001E4A0553|nr:class I SAM-dependent DNA methyltransferase [Brachybacterium halotolerans]UEJ82926.1 type I restriction-modification system subunit M [Brachybacterium halotolerans subsp. kimchii]
MPTKKAAPVAPSTPKELKDTLWKAADKLRGSMDASQYKDVVLGLVFLKYVADAFEERREGIRAELSTEGEGEEAIADALEDIDEYAGHNVFWVAPEARWSFIAEHAKGIPASSTQDARSVGDLIDRAMEQLAQDNGSLEGTLPTMYGRSNVDQRRLGELVDLLNSARFSGEGATKARDLLGEVYEYFLDKFAKAEGKRGGEFYTPPVLVRTLVEILEPHRGRVYDPCCGSGGMFVQAEKFLEAQHEDPTHLSIYGQELNERTWRMAKMNLAIHGIDSSGLGKRWGDTFARDIHPGLVADFVLANPPFNIKDWSRSEDDPRWTYGVPPVRNANYAWMQHIISKLGSQGEAAVVMANGTMASNTGGEGEIRKNMLQAGLVSCVIAMPPNLFRSVAIPVCVWFFAKDKRAGARGTVDRSREVLFIDAREMGHMVDRVERTFSDEDIHTIANTFRTWRGRESADGEYADVPGFCKSATIQEIADAGWAVTPGRFVGAPEPEEDDEPIDEKIARLTQELTAALDESARLDGVVREQLGRLA